MFCNYVTLHECGLERIASRQGDLTNFHAAEPERLASLLMRLLPVHALRTHVGCSRTLLPRSSTFHICVVRLRSSLRSGEGGTRSGLARKTAEDLVPWTPKSTIIIENLGELRTSWSTCATHVSSRTKSRRGRTWTRKTRLHCAIGVDFRLQIRSLPFTTCRQPDVADMLFAGCWRYPVEIIFLENVTNRSAWTEM